MAILGLLQYVKNSFLICVIVSCLSLRRSAEDPISVFPSDTEAGIGQTVTLYCRIIHAVGNDIEWHHTPYGLQKLNAVYLDGFIYSNYRARFTVTGVAQQGERNLNIYNVSFEDAGKYICMHKTDSHTAELIVFGTFPSSQSCAAIIPNDGLIGSNVCRLEPDNINIVCNYSYCGNKVPVVEWKNAKGSILPSVLTSRPDVNTSTLIHKVLKGDTFTCYMKYMSSDIPSNFSWTVSINVHNISHSATVQNIGCDSQTITCAKPRLPYNCVTVWKSSNGTVLPKTTLYTTDLSNGLYTCSAQCSIRGTACSIQQLTVDRYCTQDSASAEPQSNPPESGVYIAVALSLVIITASVVVTIICIRRRRKNGDTTIVSQPPHPLPAELPGEPEGFDSYSGRGFEPDYRLRTVNKHEAEANQDQGEDETVSMLLESQNESDKQQPEAIEDPTGNKDELLLSNLQHETDMSTRDKRGRQDLEPT